MQSQGRALHDHEKNFQEGARVSKSPFTVTHEHDTSDLSKTVVGEPELARRLTQELDEVSMSWKPKGLVVQGPDLALESLSESAEAT